MNTIKINARSSNSIQKSNSLLFHWWVTLTLPTGTETWLVKFEGNVRSTHCTFLVKVSSVFASFRSEKVINVIFIIFMLWLWKKFKSVSIHSYACDICNLPIFSMCVSFTCSVFCLGWQGAIYSNKCNLVSPLFLVSESWLFIETKEHLWQALTLGPWQMAERQKRPKKQKVKQKQEHNINRWYNKTTNVINDKNTFDTQ